MLARSVLLAAVLFLPGGVSLAYQVSEYTMPVPYDVYRIDTDISAEHWYVGNLEDFPEMYEFTIEATTTLGIALFTLPGDTTPDLGGIIVRDTPPRGVAEVARLKSGEASWETDRDGVSGLTFRQGPTLIEEIGPGTYRIELSTPDNAGPYVLRLGTEANPQGYFAAWGATSRLYEFAGVTKFGMIRSPLVYYPLGILIVLGLIGVTFWYTRRPLRPIR
jgi:hypothetical protein